MTGSLQQTIAHYRAQLLAREEQALRVLAQAHQATLATIQPRIDALMRQIAEKQKAGETIPLSWLYEEHRLQAIKTLIESQMTHYGVAAQMVTQQQQQYALALGTAAGMASLQASLPPGITYSFGTPSPDALIAIVGQTKAGPLSDLFNGFGSEAAQAASKALITGLTLGNNPRVIARSLSDALSISYNRAATIARDQMVTAYRTASVECYRANADVVDKMRRTCDLTPRTCAACIALDGTLYDLDEDPGFHPCDRCALVPVTNSWADILDGTGIDTSDIPDTPSPTDWQTGQEWFDKQSAEVQQSILGKQAYQLYSDGTITLDDMVTTTHDPQWGKSIQQTPVKELVKR